MKRIALAFALTLTTLGGTAIADKTAKLDAKVVDYMIDDNGEVRVTLANRSVLHFEMKPAWLNLVESARKKQQPLRFSVDRQQRAVVDIQGIGAP